VSTQIERNVQKLQKLHSKKEELQAELKKTSAKIEKMEDKVGGDLGDGTHVIAGVVLDINTKVMNGRVTTSWKAVSEGIHARMLVVLSALYKEFPKYKKALKAYHTALNTAYEEIKTANTKTGEDKVVQKIKISTISE